MKIKKGIVIGAALVLASCESDSTVEHLGCNWSVSGLEEREPGFFASRIDISKPEESISVLFQEIEYGEQVGTVVLEELVTTNEGVRLRRSVARDDSGAQDVDVAIIEREGFTGFVGITGGDYATVLLDCD